jgi:hypothetical protein
VSGIGFHRANKDGLVTHHIARLPGLEKALQITKLATALDVAVDDLFRLSRTDEAAP